MMSDKEQLALLNYIRPTFESHFNLGVAERHPTGGYYDTEINDHWASFWSGACAAKGFIYARKEFEEFRD